MNILKKTLVRDIIPPNKGLVCLRDSDSIAEALKTLSQNGILSAPVLNDDGSICLGSLDILDLVAFVVSSVSHGPGWQERTRERFRLAVVEALGASKENPFLPVLDETPISDLVTNLFQKGVHRVPVYDVEANLYSIVSQSDIAAFAWNKMADPNERDLSELATQTLGKLGLTPSLVISVYKNVSVVQAFDYIIANKISGLAVVDEHGKLIGNISASDFKGFTEDNFVEYLEMQAGDFVAKQMLAVSCKQHSSLLAATSLFVNLHIHRVYIIDDLHKPIGVFSMTDLMKVLAR